MAHNDTTDFNDETAADVTTEASTSSSTDDIVLIRYQELLEFENNNKTKNDDDQEHHDHQLLINKIGQAYGLDGLGILAVTDLPPDYEQYRLELLPCAAALASLTEDELEHEKLMDAQSLYSTGWSHGKEQLQPGIPDLQKGSFYVNPLTDQLVESIIERDGPESREKFETLAQTYPSFYADNRWPSSSSSSQLQTLQPAVQNMGRLMVHVGRLLAGVCDEYCRQQGVPTNLQESLTRSLNAKGRLLHYFPIKNNNNNYDDNQNQDTSNSSQKDDNPILWCGWHNDHGSLTGLVPAIYMNEKGEMVDVSSFNNTGGLYIQTRGGTTNASGRVVRRVTLPAHALGFQIGETSQIQSGGILQATPHAVMVDQQFSNLSRESFALFLEPEFEDPLDIPVNKTLEDCQGNAELPACVVPLKDRWKPGLTFGDFHVATVTAFTKG